MAHPSTTDDPKNASNSLATKYLLSHSGICFCRACTEATAGSALTADRPKWSPDSFGGGAPLIADSPSTVGAAGVRSPPVLPEEALPFANCPPTVGRPLATGKRLRELPINAPPNAERSPPVDEPSTASESPPALLPEDALGVAATLLYRFKPDEGFELTGMGKIQRRMPCLECSLRIHEDLIRCHCSALTHVENRRPKCVACNFHHHRCTHVWEILIHIVPSAVLTV
ncbi:hypothetical protein QBC47DRAFT_120833 [Echria macrotheca]|uniref:Uncharacterized protein n=1 Tax=Echria macrotheca TaxID=438768 RepID=A0AAJ0B583_9PEZI|nr:hypothetical protein QBC47DRAFT_120833 [Echria macrotheca]